MAENPAAMMLPVDASVWFYMTAIGMGLFFAACVGWSHRYFLSTRGWPIVRLPGWLVLLYVLVLFGTLFIGAALSTVMFRFHATDYNERSYFITSWLFVEMGGIIVFGILYDKRRWVLLSRQNPLRCPICEQPVDVETQLYAWAYVRGRSCSFSKRAPMERLPGRLVYQVHTDHLEELKRRVIEDGFSPEPSLIHGPG
jgi:hypothetical protein